MCDLLSASVLSNWQHFIFIFIHHWVMAATDNKNLTKHSGKEEKLNTTLQHTKFNSRIAVAVSTKYWATDIQTGFENNLQFWQGTSTSVRGAPQCFVLMLPSRKESISRILHFVSRSVCVESLFRVTIGLRCR